MNPLLSKTKESSSHSVSSTMWRDVQNNHLQYRFSLALPRGLRRLLSRSSIAYSLWRSSNLGPIHKHVMDSKCSPTYDGEAAEL